MAMYVYEMELFPDVSGSVVAYPCDELLEGSTSGDDFADAVEYAADWLRMTLEGYLMRNEQVPKAEFGHAPQHPGGRIVVFAVEASLECIPAVTAAEAARILGVSTARVAQMCAAQRLESWKEGSGRMVTLDSIHARLEEQPKAGRPRASEKKAPADQAERPLAAAM